MLEVFDLGIVKGASDIHISKDKYIYMRIEGDLIKLENPIKEEEYYYKLKKLVGKSSLNEVKDYEFSLEYKGYRLRISMYREREDLVLACRINEKYPVPFKDLNLPKALKKFTDFEKGLVLITGPAGSGKSTTMAALIEEINLNKARHIITLEDPIEYVYENKKSVIHQRQIGRDVESFKAGIKSSLRQDPDILLIGELRDLETISSALTLAETGHLVISSLHSKSVVETITRVIDVFPSTRYNLIKTQFLNSIKGISSQRLIKGKNGHLFPNVEIMFMNNPIYNLIKNNANIKAIEDQIYMDKKIYSSQTMEQDLERLRNLGLIEEKINFNL